MGETCLSDVRRLGQEVEDVGAGLHLRLHLAAALVELWVGGWTYI